MPFRVNPIPRPLPKSYHEASGLRSVRDSDTPFAHWKKNNDVAQQVKWLTDAVIRLQQEVNRLRIRKGGDIGGGGSSPCPASQYPSPYG